MTKYRVVREEVRPDVFTYYPEFKHWWALWWSRWETHPGPFQYEEVAFANVDAARVFIEMARGERIRLKKKSTVWEG